MGTGHVFAFGLEGHVCWHTFDLYYIPATLPQSCPEMPSTLGQEHGKSSAFKVVSFLDIQRQYDDFGHLIFDGEELTYLIMV